MLEVGFAECPKKPASVAYGVSPRLADMGVIIVTSIAANVIEADFLVMSLSSDLLICRLDSTRAEKVQIECAKLVS